MIESLEQNLPNISKDIIVTDTAILANDKLTTEGIKIYGAPNDNWEFGAWDHIVKKIGNKIFEYDYIHLVTSACYSGYIDFHNYITEEMLEHFKDTPVALGHVEVYNSPVYFFNVKFQHWLRSSYIFIRPIELKLLKKLAFYQDENNIFTGCPRSPFRKDIPMCEQYKDYIHSWLTGNGTGQGTQWHSRFNLSSSNLEFYQKKAKAIFNEMSLTNRLYAQGAQVADITWLHHQDLKQISKIPHWYDQIIQRKTGHDFIKEG